MLGYLAILCALLAPPRPGVDLLDLARASSGTQLPDGWRKRPVRGFEAPTTTVIDSAGSRFLRIAGVARAGFMIREQQASAPLATATLSWSFRIHAAPPGADLTHAGTDDSPLRVFVVFEARRRLLGTPRTLFYSLDPTLRTPDARPSHVSRDLRVIGMPSLNTAGAWQEAAVDPVADYRRIWGAGQVRVAAIGVMQDSDQTGGEAIADLRSLTWSTSDAPQP